MRVLMIALLLAQTMTPSDLLQRSAKATGTLTAGTYTEHYVADGQAEHIDGVKQIAGDNYTVVERAGEFVVMWGRYNGQRWHQDENGVVLLDGGFHLKTDDDAQLGASGAERKMHVIGLTPDGVDYVLDFELLDGYHEKRYYNAKTYLLDRIERPAAIIHDQDLEMNISFLFSYSTHAATQQIGPIPRRNHYRHSRGVHFSTSATALSSSSHGSVSLSSPIAPDGARTGRGRRSSGARRPRLRPFRQQAAEYQRRHRRTPSTPSRHA